MTNKANFPVAGVAGSPVEHSLSPRIHAYWLKQKGMEGEYNKFLVSAEELPTFLGGLATRNITGVNLTIPHKESALSYMDELTPLAKCVGAINMVVVGTDGRLCGDNSDVYGIAENLRQGGCDPRNKIVAILGAGGAVRSAIVALQDMGVSDIRLINRTRSRAEKLAGAMGGKITVCDWGDETAFRDTALLINGTSLGLKAADGKPTKVDLDFKTLPQSAHVMDMVYNPLMTDFLAAAKVRGNPIIDGLGMLLYQAKPAFKAFFGQAVDVTPELRAHIMAVL